MLSLLRFLQKPVLYLFCIILLNAPAFAAQSPINNRDAKDKYALQIHLFTEITNNQVQSLDYSDSQRISTVITDATNWKKSYHQSFYQHSTDSIYWQGAGLFKTHSDRLEQQLTTILTELSAHKKNQTKALTKAIDKLTDFFNKATFKERIDIPIEYDYHAAVGPINPKLSGQYLLYLPQKPQHIWVIGAVKNPRILPFQAMGNANTYLKQVALVNKFGLDEVWVIKPNGKISIEKVAYWNKENIQTLPGSVIFVPFKKLPNQINQAIADLLQHRVMSS